MKGGEPVAPDGLDAEWPVFDDSDKRSVLSALESGSWCSLEHGPDSMNGKFEKAFSDYLGSTYGITVDNGTDALALALIAAGVEAGDEVIVPAVTFVATATAVVQVNGRPVFCDIDPETYQIDPKEVEKLINDETKAVVPVHYGGYPADMDELMEIGDENDIMIIEDAAEAHGSEWRGQRVGSIGDLGTFSFQQGKPLACGEGGFIATDDKDLATKCVSYANFGRIAGEPVYQHHWMGSNMRMTEFQAALLLSQFERLPEQTEARHANGEYLASELERIDGISALKRDPRITKRGYYFYLMRYDASGFGGVPRDLFIEALKAEGIRAGMAHNQPIYRNPLFRDMAFGSRGCPILCPHHREPVDYSKVHCPVAERIYNEEVIAMGKDFLMKRSNVDLVLEAIRKIRDNSHELE